MAIATIYPTKDTWLDSGNPAVNHGTDGTLEIGSQTVFPSVVKWRTLFHYNLNVLVVGATINSVKVRPYATQAAAVAHGALAQRVTQPNWVETIYSNWNYYAKGLGWATPGGDFTPTDLVRWNFPTSTGPFDITGFKTLSDDAIANRGGHLHLIFMREIEAGGLGNQLIIGSRENVDSGKWPALIVDYTAPTLHTIAIDGACVGIEGQIITVG